MPHKSREARNAYQRRRYAKKKKHCRTLARARYYRNHEHSIAVRKKWAAANPEKMSASSRNCTYGHGAAAHLDKQIKKQKSKCAICKRKLVSGRGTHLDHQHRPKLLRGALCGSCNRKLVAVENRKWHRAAIAYLEKWGTQ